MADDNNNGVGLGTVVAGSAAAAGGAYGGRKWADTVAKQVEDTTRGLSSDALKSVKEEVEKAKPSIEETSKFVVAAVEKGEPFETVVQHVKDKHFGNEKIIDAARKAFDSAKEGKIAEADLKTLCGSVEAVIRESISDRVSKENLAKDGAALTAKREAGEKVVQRAVDAVEAGDKFDVVEKFITDEHKGDAGLKKLAKEVFSAGKDKKVPDGKASSAVEAFVEGLKKSDVTRDLNWLTKQVAERPKAVPILAAGGAAGALLTARAAFGGGGKHTAAVTERREAPVAEAGRA